MSAMPSAPGVENVERTGFGDGADTRPLERQVVLLTESSQWKCPDNVYKARIRGAGNGAGGANTLATSKGAGAGSAAQSAVGEIDLVAGALYDWTRGALGTAAPTITGGIGLSNGTDGGACSFVGPGVNIRFLGTNGGKTDGTGGAAVGPATAVSIFGYTLFQGAKGGDGGTARGTAGDGADLMPGGDPGAGAPSGGGGGGTPFGPGGRGGSATAAGLAPPDANGPTGAGGGGAGASADAAAGGSGGAGSPAFFELVIDT